MASIVYRGYRIDAVPKLLPDSDEWTVEVVITNDSGPEMQIKKRRSDIKCKTEKEATQHCFKFGMKIIDGYLVV